MPTLKSRRTTPRIEALYAVLMVSEEGREGVVRYNAQGGSFPWITDDPALARKMLRLARTTTPYAAAYLARFQRTEET
jgi:hypothetical protein